MNQHASEKSVPPSVSADVGGIETLLNRKLPEVFGEGDPARRRAAIRSELDRLELDDKVPQHSTFSVNRLGRFRESEILRHIFERVIATCVAAGLVKGEGFAVDASVMQANASRYHGKAPDELDWTDAQRQKRAVKSSSGRGGGRSSRLLGRTSRFLFIKP